MNQPKLVVQVFDSIDKLFENEGSFILLQEGVPLRVLEQVSLSHELSHNVQPCLRVVLVVKSDDIWVMTELKDAFLELNHFFFADRQLKLLNNFNSDLLFGFFVHAPIN